MLSAMNFKLLTLEETREIFPNITVNDNTIKQIDVNFDGKPVRIVASGWGDSLKVYTPELKEITFYTVSYELAGEKESKTFLTEDDLEKFKDYLQDKDIEHEVITQTETRYV